MNIERIITTAWQRQAKWLWLLLPLSWLYACVSGLRRVLYRMGWLASYRADVPVMVIGNITVGGSGKTPLLITLVRYLQSCDVNVAVISRGYGGSLSGQPTLVTLDSLPSEVGDEPCLIVQETSVPMAVCANRQQAIELLLQQRSDYDLIIADDGLQHYRLQRDIEWIVVDSERGFGNGQLLPVGFLREPLSRLQGATVIYHQKPHQNQEHQNQESQSQKTQGDKNQSVTANNFSQKLVMQLYPDTLQPLLNPEDLQSLIKRVDLNLQDDRVMPKQGDTVYAVSGIGYPQRFFDSLTQLGFNVVECAFADHHHFVWNDFANLTDYPIIMTSKDAVKARVLIKEWLTQKKCNPHSQEYIPENTVKYQNQAQIFAKMWVLPVTAKLSENCYQRLQQELDKFNIKI